MSSRPALVLCATSWRPDRTSTGRWSPPLMRWSPKPSRSHEEFGGLTLPAIRLAPGADDASFIETAESDRRRQPYLARSRSVLLSAALSVVAATLAWTVYYDLLDRHPLPVRPPSSARPVVASLPKEPFPPDGTMVADFQPSEVSGTGLTLQMPAANLGLLFVVVFKDWQTGAYVATPPCEPTRSLPSACRLAVTGSSQLQATSGVACRRSLVRTRSSSRRSDQ